MDVLIFSRLDHRDTLLIKLYSPILLVINIEEKEFNLIVTGINM